MLKLMKLKSELQFPWGNIILLKHNNLNPIINRSTSNDGWAFSPQAAVSPVLTPTEHKSTDPRTGGVAGHSQSSCSSNILCFRTRVSEEVPKSLRLHLAQEMQMCDVTTDVMGKKFVHLWAPLQRRVPLKVNERRALETIIEGEGRSGH